MLISTRGRQIVLDDLGPPVGFRRGCQISLVGSLGKYLPGSVWACAADGTGPQGRRAVDGRRLTFPCAEDGPPASSRTLESARADSLC